MVNCRRMDVHVRSWSIMANRDDKDNDDDTDDASKNNNINNDNHNDILLNNMITYILRWSYIYTWIMRTPTHFVYGNSCAWTNKTGDKFGQPCFDHWRFQDSKNGEQCSIWAICWGNLEVFQTGLRFQTLLQDLDDFSDFCSSNCEKPTFPTCAEAFASTTSTIPWSPPE